MEKGSSKSLDGGYGWVITASSFFINMIVDGIVFSSGVFFMDLLDYFGEGHGKTAWIGSTIAGATLLTCSVSGFLIQRFGARAVTMSGALISSIGFISSTFSTNMTAFICTFGVVSGFGFGLIYLPGTVTVGYYFKKRLALATGLSLCGSGVGIFAFAPLCEYFIRIYGWQGATWMVAGITLNGMVMGALLRPVKDSQISHKEEEDTVCNSKVNEIHKTEDKNQLLQKNSGMTIFLTLVKNPLFSMYAMSSFLVYIGLLMPVTFLPYIAVSRDVPVTQATFLVSIMGITNTVFRVLCGWVTDQKWADCLIINMAALVILGGATMVCPFSTNYPLLATYAFVFGACTAICSTLRSIIMVHLLGVNRMAVSVGIIMMCNGVSAFMGTPLAGILYEKTGSFYVPFYVAGGTLVLAGLICLPLRYLANRRRQMEITNTSIGI